jgi:alkanesulfonate monooxygenase
LKGGDARPRHRNDRCYAASAQLDPARHRGCDFAVIYINFARAHEAAGFDMALVGYTASWAEGFLVAMHAAARTERLSYLVAHRPGFVAPTLFARQVATFDQLTGGRIALHVITGKTDAEQEGDGDFAPKVERYQRAQEYLHLMKRIWASDAPFDFVGRFYRVRGAHSDVRLLSRPHP